MATTPDRPANRRAVIVDGVRTPFVRAFGSLMEMDTIALGVAAVRGLLDRIDLPRDEIDGIVWGAVILPGGAPNVGREIGLDLGLPAQVEATTVSRACTSGMVAITQAVSAIERGNADVVIAGGSDSTSNAEIKLPQSFVHKTAPVIMSSRSGVKDYLRMMTRLRPRRDLIPERPAIRERTTKELMGESAERMATIYAISREEQDAFALQSHQRAAQAVESGRFDREIVPATTPGGSTVESGDIVRANTSLEKLAKLSAAFAEGGTLTAGNSSPLTDGAAAVLVMSEQRARDLGLMPVVALRGWSYDAVDPADQLLIGPAISMPKALLRSGMTLSDVDLVDIHEAFAAQVLSVLKVLRSKEFARERLGLDAAFGDIDPTTINVHGGSLAFGHPFAATGARIIITMANELHRTAARTALLGVCAQGGQSGGAVMEAV